MARLMGLLVGAVLCMATAGPAWAQSVPLPQGPYTLFAGNATAANFLIAPSIRRSGDRVNLTTYRIYKEAMPTPQGAVDQDTTALEIDCVARTSRTLAINAYRPDGGWAFVFPGEAAQPIEEGQTWDFVARIVCDGVGLPDSANVAGAAEARAMGLARLQ